MAQRVTIVDVAREAGGAISTVSAALNGREGVSAATRERVVGARSAWAGFPRSAGGACVSQRAWAVGLLLQRPASVLEVDPFFAGFLGGVETVLDGAGHALALQLAATAEQVLERVPRWALGGVVDGIFLTDVQTDDPRFALVEQLNLPAVVISATAAGSFTPSVSQDHRSGMREVLGDGVRRHPARLVHHPAADHGAHVTTRSGARRGRAAAREDRRGACRARRHRACPAGRAGLDRSPAPAAAALTFLGAPPVGVRREVLPSPYRNVSDPGGPHGNDEVARRSHHDSPVVAVVAATTLALSACSGSNATAPVSVPTDTAAVNGELNILVSSAIGSDAGFKAVNDAFTKKFPNVKLNFTSVPNENYNQARTSRLTAGSIDVGLDMALTDMIDRFYTADVLMHTWDRARAKGQPDRLDEQTAAAMLAGMEPMEPMLRSSGQFGSAGGPLPEDADASDRLISFIGRDPSWARP